MSPRAYCALQCAVPAILTNLVRRGGSTVRRQSAAQAVIFALRRSARPHSPILVTAIVQPLYSAKRAAGPREPVSYTHLTLPTKA